MSNKEVRESQVKFTRAKTPTPKKGKTTYLDNVKVSEENKLNQPVEFHFKDNGNLQDDNEFSFAMKKVYPNGVVDYFVKFATAGPGANKMLNPWGIYYAPGDEFKFEKTMGRKRYEFKKVNESIFNSYIQFLKTRNERHILLAEREANNG